MTGLVWCAASFIEGRPPLGGGALVFGDFGNQSIPFLAYYRDVLTGHADGNLLFAWGMGYGQSFWPTFTMYLANPLNLLVLAFGRLSVVDAAATVAICTAMTSAAAMASLLQKLRREDRVLAVALASAYGCCQYAVNDASYQPMWLVGVAALPLMVLSAIWVRDRSRLGWLTPVVFFTCWFSDFYTSWMASLAAGLVVITLCVAQPAAWPHPIRTIVRWAALAGLGVAMDSFSIVPTYLAVKRSAMTPNVPFEAGTARDLASRLLMGTEGLGRAPSIGVGVLLGMLLLVAVVLTWRERLTRTLVITLALTLLSMRWSVTSTVWHGFDTPDGNFYRQAFVFVAMQLLAVWLLLPRLAQRPGKHVLAATAGVAAVFGALVLVSQGSIVTTSVTTPASVALVVLGLVLIPVMVGRGRAAPTVTVCLAALLVGELVANQVAIVDARDTRYAAQTVDLGELRGQGDVVNRIRELESGGSRAGVTVRMTPNDPMLYGGTAATSYTTMMPKDVSDLMAGMGLVTTAGGRRIFSEGSPLEDATFGVDSRVTWSSGRTVVTRVPGATVGRWLGRHPKVTRLDSGRRDPIAFFSAMLNLPLTTPSVTRIRQRGSRTQLQVRCSPGSPLLLVDSQGVSLRSVPTASGFSTRFPWAGRLRSGQLKPGEAADVSFVSRSGSRRQPHMECTAANPSQLGQPAQLRRTGDGFTVTVPPRESAATLLVGTTATSEWTCSTPGNSTTSTGSLNGLLTVVAPSAGTVTCRFSPKGLAAGVAISVLAALVWLGVVGASWRFGGTAIRGRFPRRKAAVSA
ncbi:YfhO family protein [Oryzihumus sp.]